MFVVHEDKTIEMHRGDTGEMTVTIKGYDFSNVNAVALFTMKQGTTTVMERIYTMDENNSFVVEFANPDTDGLAPGAATEYDVRVAIDPEYGSDGKLVNGIVVRTPNDPIPVTLRRTVGII